MILRPYLVRPRTEHIPFVRAREGGFADALYMSSRSARNVYDEPERLNPRTLPNVRPSRPRVAGRWTTAPRRAPCP